MKTILITGGSGLIGSKLSLALIAKGYQVRHLSRQPNHPALIKSYNWDIENNSIDENAFEGVDTIIHLAGAGIAEKKWTKKSATSARINVRFRLKIIETDRLNLETTPPNFIVT